MHETWALEETAFQSLMDKMKGADLVAILAQMPQPSGIVNTDTGLVVVDGEAIIPIKGLLTKEMQGGLERLLFGEGTSYQLIAAQAEEADRNPEVVSVVYDVDSPGGIVNGMFDASRAIREASKPSTAVVNDMAASAAYVLAAQADQIISRNEAGRVGSIGVLTRQFISENIITITSTKAPFKAPDLKTQEGVDAIKEQLDMLHNLMVKEIALGRGIDVDRINRDFGRGMTLTSDIAVVRGMVDSIENVPMSSGLPGKVLAATTGFQDFEIVDVSWDARKAVRMIRESTGSQEGPSEDYRKGFFWFDRKNASDFASYKLPFTTISDGKLVAVRKAINAAHSAMQGARGGVDIPEPDRAAVQKHIDRYRTKIQKIDRINNNKKTGGRGMDLQTAISENPGIRAEVDAVVKDKVEAAVQHERGRAVAHLANIEHSAEAVVTAIKEGKAFDQAAMSDYMNAMGKAQTAAAAASDNPAAVATGDDPEAGPNAVDNAIAALTKQAIA